MKKTLTIAMVLFVAYATAAFYFSGEITTFKVKSKETVLAEDNLRGYADVDLPRPEDVSVTGGQVELNGWLFVNRKNRRCGVILHHGHAANRNGMLKYAKLFWPRGCHLLMFDARHHGDQARAHFAQQELRRQTRRQAAAADGHRRQIITGLHGTGNAVDVRLPFTERTRHAQRVVLVDGPLNAAQRLRPAGGIALADALQIQARAVISELDVLKALDSKHLSGYAADVFDVEPLPKNHRFLKHPSIILAPHMGAQTKEAQRRVNLSLGYQIIHYFQSGEIEYRIV